MADGEQAGLGRPSQARKTDMILFGVRSPLVIEFEETLQRLRLAVTVAVSVSGAPRLLDRTRLVDLKDFEPRPGDRFLACAFSPVRRAELVAQALSLGLVKAAALIDPTAILPQSLRVGDGTFINAGVVIGGLSMLGDAVLVNRSASLGHHTVLGDFVSVGPGATLAGNVHVGDGATIGAGAVVLPDIRIGARAVVAAGSVVRQHVPDGMLAAGHPARLKPFDAARSSLNMEGGE